MGVGSLVIGSIDPEYPGDQWHYILSLIVTAARAYGVQAIDGPYTDIKNTDEYRRLCNRAKQVGYDGKWVLHPDQVGIANEVFAPSQAEYRRRPPAARPPTSTPPRWSARAPSCTRGR